MMAGFEDHPMVRATFDEASAVLGEDLWALVTDGPTGPQPDDQYTARDADGGCCRLARVAAARGRCQRSSRGIASANTGAVAASACVPRRDSARALPGASDAEAVTAGSFSAMAAILSLGAESVGPPARSGAGQVVEPVNFNTPEDRDRRPP
jgi:[acyl-carrier-protein] S-malonyltransferase